jgi:organic radical activating enzyme
MIMKTNQQYKNHLNIAKIWCGSRALGPGLRSIVWVQGCNRQCEGCISPEWRSHKEAWLITPEALAIKLLENPEIKGLTFSGGEPMLQAKLLAQLVQICRKNRALNVICFTGFTLEELNKQPVETGIKDFLNEIDLLIDGPYIDSLNDNHGLRGSSNQKIHYLSHRLIDHDLENSERHVELFSEEDGVMMIGIPPHKLLNVLDLIVGQKKEMDSHITFNSNHWKEKLDSLVGLVPVKTFVKSRQVLIADRIERQRLGIISKDEEPLSLHLAFLGNPGTGKTTAANLVGEMYRDLGVLRKGHVVKAEYKQLTSEYVGGSAKRTQEFIEKACDGVLFIDEAYQLTSSSFGKEVIETLITALENERSRFALVVAGYTRPMQDFFESNPGLVSRIPKEQHITFPDFDPGELVKIFYIFLKKKGLTTTNEFDKAICQIIENMYQERDVESFANARRMRELATTVEAKRALRLKREGLDFDEKVTVDDLP